MKILHFLGKKLISNYKNFFINKERKDYLRFQWTLENVRDQGSVKVKNFFINQKTNGQSTIPSGVKDMEKNAHIPP